MIERNVYCLWLLRRVNYNIPGIDSIAVRNSQKNGGNIAVVILFLLASFLGIGLAGSFSDLNIWAGWCLINAVLAIISIFKQNKGVQQWRK